MSEHDDDPQLRALLGTLRQDPPDDGFAAQLHLRLAATGLPAEPGVRARFAAWASARPWLVGGLSGALAGVAAFALASALTPRTTSSAPIARALPTSSQVASAAVACAPTGVETSAEVFVVPAGKVALVQLHFAVDRDIEQAEFSVLLPAGLAFFSAGETVPERSFQWSAPLARGDNRVPLALIGSQPGRHRFAATATIDGEVVVHEIVLDVQGPA